MDPVSAQQKISDKKALLSQYAEIHDQLMAPIKPLLHLVGFKQSHQTVATIISEALNANAKVFKTFNIQSYDFYESQNPAAIYADQLKTDKSKPSDFGYLKLSFFKGLASLKPAITMLVFDWQNEDQNFDWKVYEAQVLTEVKQHQEKCPGARQSKIVFLIFLPLHDTNVDEKINSLRKQVEMRGEGYLKTFFVLSNGFEGLKTMAKKVVKQLNDLAFTYFREKKFAIKRKQKKLIKDQIENIRYNFKHGVYSQFTKTDLTKPLKYMKEAYQQLKSSIGHSASRFSFEERRDNADLIALKLMYNYLTLGNHASFYEAYRGHYFFFQSRLSQLKKEQQFEEYKWRANWQRLVASMLEQYPSPELSRQEYFPGYYYFNSMQLQIARKQQMDRVARSGEVAVDREEMAGLVQKPNNWIGKDTILHDKRNPLESKSQVEQRAQLDRFKLYIESLCDLDSLILDLANSSNVHYKNKSRALKGASNLMYKRMSHLISFHTSEFVLIQQDPLRSQKYRKQIAKALISENWTHEALQFVEKAKGTASSNLDDFFLYEMEILNYSAALAKEERHKRFLALIQRVLQDSESEKQLHLEAFLVGPKLIWCRASWQESRIQANSFNVLKVEVLTPIKDTIVVKKVLMKLNEATLNQEVEEELELSQGKPIVIEREMFFSNENVNLREYFLLNEVILEVKGQARHRFSINLIPYLAPENETRRTQAAFKIFLNGSYEESTLQQLKAQGILVTSEEQFNRIKAQAQQFSP